MIQKAHQQCQGDMGKKCNVIREAVASLPSEEAIAFFHHFNALMDRAYTWPLWGAAYILQGGCSDDSFSDFRASLISRGQQAYEQALANPDDLADQPFDTEAWFYEGFQYAVADGVEATAGTIPPRSQPHPQEPAGEAWQEEDLNQLFPKLSALFAEE